MPHMHGLSDIVGLPWLDTLPLCLQGSCILHTKNLQDISPWSSDASIVKQSCLHSTMAKDSAIVVEMSGLSCCPEKLQVGLQWPISCISHSAGPLPGSYLSQLWVCLFLCLPYPTQCTDQSLKPGAVCWRPVQPFKVGNSSCYYRLCGQKPDRHPVSYNARESYIHAALTQVKPSVNQIPTFLQLSDDPITATSQHSEDLHPNPPR